MIVFYKFKKIFIIINSLINDDLVIYSYYISLISINITYSTDNWRGLIIILLLNN